MAIINMEAEIMAIILRGFILDTIIFLRKVFFVSNFCNHFFI